MKIKFTCPKCRPAAPDGGRIEEVMTNVTVSAVLNEVHEDGDAEYGEQSNEGGEVDRFQCMNCGWIIRRFDNEPITEYGELFDWLRKNEFLVKE